MTGPIAELTLADWRRRIAELYAEVRRLSATDPVAALDHWRRVREELFRTHPNSPVLPADKATFSARHFPRDPALRFEVKVVPDAGEGDAPSEGEATAKRPRRPADVARPVRRLGSHLGHRPLGHLGPRGSSNPAPARRPRQRHPDLVRRALPRSPDQRRRRDGLPPHRLGRRPVSRRRATSRAVLDGGLRRRPVPALPRRHQSHRDIWRRALPARCRQERRSRRRPRSATRSCSTSTSRTSRRAPSIRSGRARWRRARTGSTSRCAPANAWPDRAMRRRDGRCLASPNLASCGPSVSTDQYHRLPAHWDCRRLHLGA